MGRSLLARVWMSVVAASAAVAAGVLVGPGTALAGNPGPVQVPLTVVGVRGAGCPGGTFVTVNPGPIQAPWSFVLINPGPINCPAGVDVLRNPGPQGTPQGQAVALPLTAASCAAGTALLTSELTLLGGSPTGGPIGAAPADPTGADPCPGGTAALSALQAALTAVPTTPGVTGRTWKNPGPVGISFVQINPGPTQLPAIQLGYALDPVGTPVGVLVEKDPGPVQVPAALFLVQDSSGTPGVTVLKNPGPQG